MVNKNYTIIFRSEKGHFERITNIDLSSVVIEQQRRKYPNQDWLVMDVLNMDFENNKFKYVIDKSLIDTLLCSSNG